MATVNNWVDHLNASKAADGQAGPIFPGAGSEGLSLIHISEPTRRM